MPTIEQRPVAERGSRWLRDFHLGLGGIALVGAVVLPPAAVALTGFAAYEGLHAGFWEATRRFLGRNQKAAK